MMRIKRFALIGLVSLMIITSIMGQAPRFKFRLTP